MDFIMVSYIGEPLIDHELLTHNGVTRFTVCIDGNIVDANQLCAIYNLVKQSWPVLDGHIFYEFLDGALSCEQHYCISKALLWHLAKNTQLDMSLRAPISNLLSVAAKELTFIKPEKSLSCWVCRMSEENKPFRVAYMKGFPKDSNLLIVPTHDHNGKSLEIPKDMTLYKSPRSRAHKYLIGSDKEPIDTRYVEYLIESSTTPTTPLDNVIED
jgi:hypothetical protein